MPEPCFPELLTDVSGEPGMLDRMMPGVYAELRRLAASYMGLEKPAHTLQPTALVHEAYLRMTCQRQVDWRNRAQFLAIAARMMRRILLDHAAGRNAAKRGGAAARVTLTDDLRLEESGEIDLLDIDAALQELERMDPEQAAVVELRFYGGLNNNEIAEALSISRATSRRRWLSARLWLAQRLAELRSP